VAFDFGSDSPTHVATGASPVQAKPKASAPVHAPANVGQTLLSVAFDSSLSP